MVDDRSWLVLPKVLARYKTSYQDKCVTWTCCAIKSMCMAIKCDTANCMYCSFCSVFACLWLLLDTIRCFGGLYK